MDIRKTTPSEENYIEHIYRLSSGGGALRPAELAECLGVKRPSATRAVASLVEKGLVRHEPYGDIKLTKEGDALGAAIVRRDECLTALFVNVLGMSLESADPEVHRLEHVLSDEVLERLQVLVDFASTSEAWLKRLHHRITTKTCESQREGAFMVGQSGIHQGRPQEKGSAGSAAHGGSRKS